MLNHLKQLARDRHDWSLYRLADELHIPQQTVYSWAHARTQPSFESMDRLCAILECTMGELFTPEPVQRKLF